MKKEIHSEHLTLSDLYSLSCPLNEDDCKRLMQTDGSWRQIAPKNILIEYDNWLLKQVANDKL